MIEHNEPHELPTIGRSGFPPELGRPEPRIELPIVNSAVLMYQRLGKAGMDQIRIEEAAFVAEHSPLHF